MVGVSGAVYTVEIVSGYSVILFLREPKGELGVRSQYGLIVVWAVVIASVFFGAFFLKFGSWPTSDDPADWADFATYLSGTIGVTAVVGTLFAFVVTLSQQQKLIDSQDKMLKKQKKQIKINKIQLKEEEARRAVELAHNSAVMVFPILIERFKSELPRSMSVYEDEVDLFVDLRESFKKSDITYDDFFFKSEILLDVFKKHDVSVVSDVVERVFSCSDRIYSFSSKKMKIAPDLKEFFQAYMFEEVRFNNEICEYIWCYHAFLMGRGKKDSFDLGVDYLDFSDNFDNASGFYIAWIEIGKMLENA